MRNGLGSLCRTIVANVVDIVVIVVVSAGIGQTRPLDRRAASTARQRPPSEEPRCPSCMRMPS